MRDVLLGVARAVVCLALSSWTAMAQTDTNTANTSNAETIISNWLTQCFGPTREAEVDCTLERSISLKQTGQLLAKLSIRVPSETRAPVLLVQTPHGLFLPTGLELQIDDGIVERINLNTCDANGCYGATDLSTETLNEMIRGANLKLKFQNLAKNTITVSLPLTGFTDAFNKVK